MALEEIKQKFGGKWKLNRRENMEEFLKAIDANMVMRKLMTTINPEEEVTVEGEYIVVKMTAGPMTKETKFKLNEEFEEERMGISMKNICRYEDGKIIMDSTPLNKPKMKVQHATREAISNDELLVTVVVGDGDVTCKRYFKRIK